MPYQELVIPSKDADIYINVTGVPIKIDTGIRFNRSFTRTVDPVFAISHEDAIATSSSSASYGHSLSLQSGEYHVILDAINGSLPAGQAPYASWLHLPPFTLVVAEHMKNMVLPYTVLTSYLNCQISSDSGSIEANSTNSEVDLEATGTGIKRSVFPIAA